MLRREYLKCSFLLADVPVRQEPTHSRMCKRTHTTTLGSEHALLTNIFSLSRWHPGMPTLMGLRNGEEAAFLAPALLVMGNCYNSARWGLGGGNRGNGVAGIHNYDKSWGR